MKCWSLRPYLIISAKQTPIISGVEDDADQEECTLRTSVLILAISRNCLNHLKSADGDTGLYSVIWLTKKRAFHNPPNIMLFKKLRILWGAKCPKCNPEFTNEIRANDLTLPTRTTQYLPRFNFYFTKFFKLFSWRCSWWLMAQEVMLKQEKYIWSEG